MFKNYSLPLFTFTNNSNFKIVRKLLIVSFFKLISVLVISKLILSAHIYLPGLHWIAQTLIYLLEKPIDTLPQKVFNFHIFFFFLFTTVIDLLLLVFAYFYISKNYAKFSFFATMIFFLFAIILSLQKVHNWPGLNFLDFSLNLQGYERTKELAFYFVAFVAGVLSGIASSFIWKENVSAGGLDYIFTYFALKKHKKLSTVAFFVSAIFATISILVNEIGEANFSFPVFIYLFSASMIFNQLYISIINYLYPKYRLVKIFIITQKGNLIRKEIKKFYKHGGNILQTRGMYDNLKKEMIITIASYAEKDFLLERLKKVDAKIFFISTPVIFLDGNFVFSENEN